jgi:hypothetical protein
MNTKEFEIVEFGVEDCVDLGLIIKDSLIASQFGGIGGNSYIVQRCVSGWHH